MAKVRDENNLWTTEANKYANKIDTFVSSMLDLGKKWDLVMKTFFILLFPKCMSSNF